MGTLHRTFKTFDKTKYRWKFKKGLHRGVGESPRTEALLRSKPLYFLNKLNTVLMRRTNTVEYSGCGKIFKTHCFITVSEIGQVFVFS